MLHLALVVAVACAGSFDSADDSVVMSTAGPIRGVTYGNSYTAYYGVPFAE